MAKTEFVPKAFEFTMNTGVPEYRGKVYNFKYHPHHAIDDLGYSELQEAIIFYTNLSCDLYWVCQNELAMYYLTIAENFTAELKRHFIYSSM